MDRTPITERFSVIPIENYDDNLFIFFTGTATWRYLYVHIKFLYFFKDEIAVCHFEIVVD